MPCFFLYLFLSSAAAAACHEVNLSPVRVCVCKYNTAEDGDIRWMGGVGLWFEFMKFVTPKRHRVVILLKSLSHKHLTLNHIIARQHCTTRYLCPSLTCVMSVLECVWFGLLQIVVYILSSTACYATNVGALRAFLSLFSWFGLVVLQSGN